MTVRWNSAAFQSLRIAVAELSAVSRRGRTRVLRTRGPRVEPPREEDIVECGDFLAAASAAIARSVQALRGAAVALDLKNDPVTLRFSGRLVSVSEGDGRVHMTVRPEPARGKNGKKN